MRKPDTAFWVVLGCASALLLLVLHTSCAWWDEPLTPAEPYPKVDRIDPDPIVIETPGGTVTYEAPAPQEPVTRGDVIAETGGSLLGWILGGAAGASLLGGLAGAANRQRRQPKPQPQTPQAAAQATQSVAVRKTATKAKI